MLVLSTRRVGVRIGAGDSGMRARIFHLVLGLAAALLPVAARAQAQHPIPESERWATITHPGNAPYSLPEETPGVPRYAGQVDYEYQISRTEVTGTEWFEFVQAYAPFVDEIYLGSSEFYGRSVRRVGFREYELFPGAENRPTEVSWRFAARFCNWMHNGKALTAEAFESGAYDTSTFGDLPDGQGFTDQQMRSPGARYWMPSVDEWIKAAHFDPNRYGEGMPGYWLCSISSDTAPLPGLPQNGGQTNTGGSFAFQITEVAAYRDVQSPWGLWDTSGGYMEWTEGVVTYDINPTPYPVERRVQGSDYRDGYLSSISQRRDFIDGQRSQSPNSLHGFRIARAVPGAGSAGVWSVCACSLISRRRRTQHDTPRRFARCSHDLGTRRLARGRRSADHADSGV